MSWTTKRLDDLCDVFTDGDWIESKDQSPKGIRLVQTGNIGEGEFRDHSDRARYVSEETFHRLKCTEVHPGDCLISRLPEPVGRACIIPEMDGRMITGVDCSILRFKRGDMEPEFFTYYSQSDRYLSEVAKLISGTTRDRISRKNLGAIPVPVPPTPERKRIVAKLDAAFAALGAAEAHVERNRHNARELFESYLNGVFEGKGWEMKRLQDVSLQFGRGKSKHRPRNDERLFGGPYPFIQTGDVRNSDHLINTFGQTYSEFGLAQSKLWPKGTLCITIAANIAETAVLGFDACFPDSVIGMVADNAKCDIHYVEFLLQSFKSVLKAKGKGSAQDNINLGTFENQVFPFPKREEQRRIAQVLDGILERSRALETTYAQKLRELAALKKSLLGAAFRGGAMRS